MEQNGANPPRIPAAGNALSQRGIMLFGTPILKFFPGGTLGSHPHKSLGKRAIFRTTFFIFPAGAHEKDFVEKGPRRGPEGTRKGAKGPLKDAKRAPEAP